ncbi:MAG: GntR family transcriptional regulator [Frankia sp.]|nr:GntR family transcriptional regulator [Frankia sp.]
MSAGTGARGGGPRGRAFRRRGDGELAADHIRELIVAGELRRGERLAPDEIAEELGISRIPVREGIIALEREGWVEIEPRRGSFVRGIDRTTVLDHYDLLGAMLGFVAARAAQRRDDAEVSALAARERELADAGCVHDSTDALAAFLAELRRAARSVRADRVLRVLPEFVRADSLPTDLRADVIDTQRRGAAEVLAGVRERDPAVAARAARRLYRRLGDLVATSLDRRGVFADDDEASPRRPVPAFRWAFSPDRAAGDADGGDDQGGSGGATRHQSGAERAARYVREKIIRGELAPRERLDRELIGEAIGVSQTPMREAVVALEREGWITVEPHRGAFVNSFDADYLRDHYELFAIIFGTATALATRRAGGDLVERLLALNEELQRAGAAGDAEEFQRVNFAILDLLVRGAASAPLVAMLRAMPEIVPGNFFAQVPGAMDAQRHGFAQVCAALRAGDTAGVETAWWSLMSGVATRVIAYL